MFYKSIPSTDAYPERFVQNTETIDISVIVLGLLCPGNEFLFAVHVKKKQRKKEVFTLE